MKKRLATLFAALALIISPLTALAANGDVMTYDGKGITGSFTMKEDATMLAIYTTEGFLDSGGRVVLTSEDGGKYKIGAGGIEVVTGSADTHPQYGGRAKLSDHKLDVTAVYVESPKEGLLWSVRAPMEEGLNEFLAAEYELPEDLGASGSVKLSGVTDLLSWFINANESTMSAEDLVAAAKTGAVTDGAVISLNTDSFEGKSPEGSIKDEHHIPVLWFISVVAVVGIVVYYIIRSKKKKAKEEEKRRDAHIKAENELLKDEKEAELLKAAAEWDKEYEEADRDCTKEDAIEVAPEEEPEEEPVEPTEDAPELPQPTAEPEEAPKPEEQKPAADPVSPAQQIKKKPVPKFVRNSGVMKEKVS